MSTNLIVNGVTYPFPTQDDPPDWGYNVSAWATGITNAVFPKAGGLFSLTGEIDLGPNFGFRSIHIKSSTPNPSSTGFIRLSYTDSISFRDSLNLTDIAMTVNGANQLVFNGVIIGSGQILAGAGISVLGNTVSNTGVLSNIAGSNISVSSASGNVTIAVTGTVPSASLTTNIVGGASGAIAYQTAPNTTAQLLAGTASQVLVSGASPSWTNAPTLTGTNFSVIPNGALSNSSTTIGTTSIALGASSTVLGGLTSVSSTSFVGALTGNADTVSTNANLTGDVTSVGNVSTLTNAPVIAKVLTGYISGAGTVASTDSILQAIQKLNGNDATNANLTGMVTSVGNATTVVTNANLTGPITSVGNGTAIADGAIGVTKIGGTSTLIPYFDSTGFMGTDSTLSFNDTTKNLSVTSVSGAFTGALTGNASTATTAGNVTGVVTIANGGTGQVTAGAALIALGERTSGTGSLMLPTGTTAQRDVSPTFGMTRGNSTLNMTEWWNGTAWAPMGGGATGAPGNYAFVENDQIVTGNYTLGAGKNASSAGPISINTGVTVTVPTGATWVIV